MALTKQESHNYYTKECGRRENKLTILFSEADPKCPIVPSSIYGDTDEDVNDAREELDAALEKDMPPGPGSGECGCISGPAYPNIGECDFW